MVVLAFQLFVLFNAITAVNKTHGELSFHDGNNNRNIVREVEKSNQMIPAAASQGIADTTTYYRSNQTDCTEKYNTKEYNDSGRFETSSQPSLREIQWKINMFWTTVIIISILWMLILIGLTAVVYIRIVYMHHTISQIFCPKD